ncbi:MAG TPA: winged helix-turn-helix domain-containing protein [Nitrospira sp.]|nr:winged helix-turn-helix domain-containing protein [Nitrospira sp.]
MEELTDILVGLEQRITAYKHRLQELEKKRRRLDDEIATIKKYLELAETLYRVEADKAKVASLSGHAASDDRGLRHLPVVDVTDQSREILLGRSKYAGKSVPEAAYQMLREANRPMHAKELVQRLLEGGLTIKGKTPLTSVATSLKRDKRFRKVGPNTFEALDDVLIHAV